MAVNTCPVTLIANPANDIPPNRFVTLTANGVQLATNGGDVIGINHTDFKAADFAAGRMSDALAVTTNPGSIDEVEGSAAIAQGAAVASAAAGKAKVAATGNFRYGVATNAISADGEHVSILIGAATGRAQA